MEEDTEVNLGFDKELLYKNMVDAKADWLYELPMWDEDLYTGAEKDSVYGAEKVRNDHQGRKDRKKRSLSMRKRQKI